MARIRSIHPGIFTDEAYMALSLAARELIKGLWVEADDQGAFQWKPLTLKARIFPADNIDVSAVLSELEAGNLIRSYEHEGQQLGLVRNFRKFQRPKSPNATHFIPEDLRSYVGLSPSISEIPVVEPPSFPPKGEKSPQMEEEGCRRKGKDGKKEPAQHLPPSTLPREDDPKPIAEAPRQAPGKPRDAPKSAQSAAPLVSQQATEIIAAFDRACKAAWPESPRNWPAPKDAVIAMRWIEAGADASLVEATASAVFARRAAKGEACPNGLGYLEGPIEEALTARHGKGSSGNGAKPAPYRSPYTDAEREAMRREDAAFEASKAGSAP